MCKEINLTLLQDPHQIVNSVDIIKAPILIICPLSDVNTPKGKGKKNENSCFEKRKNRHDETGLPIFNNLTI